MLLTEELLLSRVRSLQASSLSSSKTVFLSTEPFGMSDTSFHFTRRSRLVAPKSPDLNPVDYRIWGEMQQRLYQMKARDVDELKQHTLCLACVARRKG